MGSGTPINSVHFSVASRDRKEWKLTAIYTSPMVSKIKELWGKLDEMVIERPWVLIGDFNFVLKAEERCFTRGVSSSLLSGWREEAS